MAKRNILDKLAARRARTSSYTRHKKVRYPYGALQRRYPGLRIDVSGAPAVAVHGRRA
tara:strand:- start:11610 stop:11783 length:174 start_codon:yes stop_codon:yes gene_type:complete